MMKTILISLLSILLSAASFAQVPQENALLWEVSGGGLSKPSYVFGTFHLLCADDILVSETLKDKLANTQQLYLELNFSDSALQEQLTQQAVMRGDTSLAQFFSTPDYEQLSADFQRFTGAPINLMARMKPYLLTAVLMMPLMQCEVKGWEQVLLAEAKNNDIAVNGLETVADQMAVFDAIPYRLQAEQLQKCLENTDSLAQVMQQMVSLYKQKDIVQLHRLVAEDQTLKTYSKLLLDERNEKWIPIIEEQAQLIPTFFAVGAGHLGGEHGVISLLRKEGYIVTPVAQ